MNVLIVRHAYLPNVTLGRLYTDGFACATLEEPWIANQKGPGGQRRDAKAGMRESCVPDGVYHLKPHNGTLFKNVYRLSSHDLGVYDVPQELPSREWGRASVLIHSGNTTADILGCILVGSRHGQLDGEFAVLESRAALDRLRTILGADRHNLEIRPSRGTEEAA